MYTAVAVQLDAYVQYGSHIWSVLYVKYVYNVLCHMNNCSDFICGTYAYASSILSHHK